MKKNNWKTMTVATVAIVIAALGISDFAMAGNLATSTKSQGTKQQKLAIRNDVQLLQLRQQKVDLLQKQLQDSKNEPVKHAAVKSELKKTKADLKRDKAYLVADKKALMDEHRSQICARRKAVEKERANVAVAKAKLFAALFKTKPTNVNDAVKVVNSSHQLQLSKTELKAAVQNKNDDLLAVNQDIREVKGQNALVLGVEDGSAKLQALAMK